MKDFIALGFIVALIGATSAAIASAHGHGPAVAMTGTVNVDTAGIDREARGSVEQNLYVAQNDSGFAYDY